MNKALVNRYKAMYKQINLITPEIYASMAIMLHRKGFSTEEIEDMFALSQEIWNECIDRDVNMIQRCLEETGVSVELNR